MKVISPWEREYLLLEREALAKDLLIVEACAVLTVSGPIDGSSTRTRYRPGHRGIGRALCRIVGACAAGRMAHAHDGRRCRPRQARTPTSDNPFASLHAKSKSAVRSGRRRPPTPASNT